MCCLLGRRLSCKPVILRRVCFLTKSEDRHLGVFLSPVLESLPAVPRVQVPSQAVPYPQKSFVTYFCSPSTGQMRWNNHKVKAGLGYIHCLRKETEIEMSPGILRFEVLG